MTILKLNTFGTILTGREFGKKTMEGLTAKLQYPVTLDFSGVISLGSSFGDELIPPIANAQDGTIVVVHANKAIWDCLTQIMEDHRIKIIAG